MGSGPRFKISMLEGFGIGLYVNRFPHAVSINVNLILINIYVGFGKGYDE